MHKIYDSISNLTGIGDAKTKKFNKKKVKTIEDLIRFYPRDYIKHKPYVSSFADAMEKQVPIKAVVAGKPKVERKTGKCITKVVMHDENGEIFMATWFNITGASLGIKNGDRVVLDGKCSVNEEFKFITHPALYKAADYEELINRPDPVYSLTEGLTNNIVRKCVIQALEQTEINETLPENIRKKYNFPPLKDVLRMVHSPQSYDELKNANSYLAYEEMYLFMYNLKIVEKENKQVENNFSFADSNFVKIFCKALPFQLTNGQTEALSDIFKDLTSETITSRLIQGDVGCGKTMVALISLLFAVENNHQAAFMVPTEVLARQHYDETVRLLKNAGTEINVRLLTSQTSKKEKQMILEELKLGFPILVIGTHSVINATDAFTDLALVFVDEQHKFGVNQREEIVKNHPHVVTMTATPIPRSLSLTLYGNDSVSEIKELPSGRLPIKSCKISEKKLNDAFLFIEREVEHKHQAYVVCPAIEDAEGIEIYSVDKVVDILNTNFPQIKAEGIHGKTSKENRERIMREYKNGNIDVLVSTTVIEVGINVPNATTMMIMNAERFGLATLHQLRGRVGRGTLQSYCILIDCLETETSAERLDTIVKSNNGFEIAEADLVQRGPGELLGTEQSGMWNFKKADISDTKMLQLVLKDVALQENTSTTHHLAKC